MNNSFKYAQALDGAVQGLSDGLDEAIELVNPEETSKLQTEDVIGGLTPKQESVVKDSAQKQSWNRVISQIKEMPPEVMGALERTPDFQRWQEKVNNISTSLDSDIKELGVDGADLAVGQTDNLLNLERNVISRALALEKAIQEGLAKKETIQQQIISFNLKNYKAAQTEARMTRFPVSNEGDFIAKFVDDLLEFNNKAGTPQYENARLAAEEIRDVVSPGFEEEANSILESIMQLDVTQRDKASDYLLKIYKVLLPPLAKEESQQMEPVMSKTQTTSNTNTIDGIVQYSLTEKILNNRSAQNNDAGVVKTAADQFGQEYLLYGPTEKRVCPKLRGKNLSVGDIVSEHTCRHHCEDGIVIDDNKTICGEALWRANVMDKFSTEYADKDGNIVGGYFNKRFEINHNIPEENRRRLKPGEIRKPKPASWGNLESRLQDMRAKEGEKRGYRPNVNTGTAFDWAKDVDQNNVNQTQNERDRREKSSGHKLVQYNNRIENDNTKKAFNMKTYKTSQISTSPKELLDDLTTSTKPKNGKHLRDNHQPKVNPVAAGVRSPADINNLQGIDGGKPMSKKKSFNMKYFKVSKEKGTVYKGEHFEYNPWAVCHSQGLSKKKNPDKFERCVQSIKDKSREEKKKKTAETPHPHTVAFPDINIDRQDKPQDTYSPALNTTKKKN